MFGQEPPPKSPSQEDAATYLVTYLRSETQPTYGYDIWLPNVVEVYAQHGARVSRNSQVPRQWIEQLSDPFYAAAWDLCRLGVLRPGTQYWQAQSHGDGDGYCITPRGRAWLGEQDTVPFIPTDSGRTGALLTSAGARFGSVYRTRAMEAAVCYSAGAYYACCAMVGAAAESVMLALGAARLGQQSAEKLYYSKNGRKHLEDELIKDAPVWLARDVRGHTALIALWRDQASHAHEAVVSEGEAYMALRGLLRFAHLTSEHWSTFVGNA